MLAKGNNQISGKIHFEPDRGHVFAYPNTVVTCEGNEVTLIPYTDYAREWALKYYGKPVTDVVLSLRFGVAIVWLPLAKLTVASSPRPSP